MKEQKINTAYPSVRYYEHTTRKQRNGQLDRYFSIRYYLDGKRIEEGIGWATEGWNAEKAAGILARLKENKRTGSGPVTLAAMREEAQARRQAKEQERAAAQRRTILVDEFFAEYVIPHIKRQKSSWQTDVKRYNKLISPAIGKTVLQAVTRQDVERFRDSLTDSGAAPGTVKQYLGIIRQMYALAARTMQDGAPFFTGQSPAQGVKSPREYNEAERYLTAREAEALFAFTQKLRARVYADAAGLAAGLGITEAQATELIERGGRANLKDIHDAATLSLNTGLRLGEICRQRWVDVNLPDGFITVPREAGRKTGGKVPMNDVARAVYLCRQAESSGHQLVFAPAKGETVAGLISHGFKVVVDILGFNSEIAPGDRKNRVVFHTLRHTFASWLALGGTDIYRIKTLMRHKRIEMTMRYAHLIPDATRDAVHSLKPPKAL